ncbi:MAG: hypothetical protein IKN73_01385 [Alphaproteobacteria bacterium]|nr:hypothetical protein [Alphaproteobacteria bacterium]
MRDKYNAFANKVLFWPLLASGNNSLGISQDKFIETIYKEAFNLLYYSSINKHFSTFNMVCIRLKEIRFYESIKIKSPDMYKNMLKTKDVFYKDIEKRRKENKDFNECWNVYMLGFESAYKKSLQR